MTAVQGICISDPLKRCTEVEKFCGIIKNATPLISGCKVSIENKNMYFMY